MYKILNDLLVRKNVYQKNYFLIFHLRIEKLLIMQTLARELHKKAAHV